jgi:hypothetical protein
MAAVAAAGDGDGDGDGDGGDGGSGNTRFKHGDQEGARLHLSPKLGAVGEESCGVSGTNWVLRSSKCPTYLNCG